MYTRKELGTEECLEAVNTIIEAVVSDGAEPVAIAIVDTHGDLICYTRMDGYDCKSTHQACNEVANRMCIKKAVTASHWSKDTKTIAGIPNINIPIDFSTEYTVMPGGLAIVEPGKDIVYGGIGVGGRPNPMEDERLARIGLTKIQEIVWG